MDAVSLNTEPVGDDDADEFEKGGDCGMVEFVGQAGVIQGENPLPPAVGMEFESYEDVYYFYSCYGKEHGFGVRVSNTWYRKSREKYRGKLSCSSAGFKKRTDANCPRPETRTGCPAMVKFRLMENQRWRIIDVELEHNHLISPGSGKFFKSHKLSGVSGTKRTFQLEGPEEVHKIRLFHTVIIDSEGNEGTCGDDQFVSNVLQHDQLKLKEGDARAVQEFFSRFQWIDPNFFYVADLNEKGYMRNLFWASARSRAAYSYFCDVVAIDTKCLKKNFEVPLVLFAGTNHHGQPILLGCGLLASQNIESYTWLLRAWLTCMLGRPPQTIITDQGMALQAAVADVFPRASHCLNLSHIMERVYGNLAGTPEIESVKLAFHQIVHHLLKTEEFESAWENLIHCHGIKDHTWVQELYEDRKKWVPAYLKETFLAGLLPIQNKETMASIFEGTVDEHTPLRKFLDTYDQVLQTSYQLEASADAVSSDPGFTLSSRCYFDLQLSKLYTNEIFKRFQVEVAGIYSCFITRPTNGSSSVITYMVKEQVRADENAWGPREFEVMYNQSEMEVLCSCGLFNFQGFLCRHALTVLNHNGLQEIPPQYILARWRKDIRRTYVLDHRCSSVDIRNPVRRYDQLYKCLVQVVEEGRKSEDHYKLTVQGLDEILNKLHLVEDQPCNP